MSDGGHEKQSVYPLWNISFAQKPSRDIRTGLDQKHCKNWGRKLRCTVYLYAFRIRPKFVSNVYISNRRNSIQRAKRETWRCCTVLCIVAVTNTILLICGLNYNIAKRCKTQQIRMSRIDSSSWQHDSWADFPTEQVQNCLTFFLSLSFCLFLTVVQQLMWLTETLGWPWMAHVSPRQNAASWPGLAEVRLSLPVAPGLTWLHSFAAIGPRGPYCIIVPHKTSLTFFLSHTHTHTGVNYLNVFKVSKRTRFFNSILCVYN